MTECVRCRAKSHAGMHEHLAHKKIKFLLVKGKNLCYANYTYRRYSFCNSQEQQSEAACRVLFRKHVWLFAGDYQNFRTCWAGLVEETGGFYGLRDIF